MSWIQTFKNWLKLSRISHERFISNLKQLNSILAQSPLHEKYWLNGGLVLGYAREKQPLLHDPDADFGIRAEDEDALLKSLPALEAAGFKKKYRWTNSQGTVTHYTLQKDHAHFEFFLHFSSEDKRDYIWYAYHKRNKIELIRQMEKHRLEPVKFLDCSWLIPSPTDFYLEKNYGDWKTPQTHFDYTTSVPCNVKKGPWSGTTRW